MSFAFGQRCYGCGKLGLFICRHCEELKFFVHRRVVKLQTSFPFLYQQFPVGLKLAAHLKTKQQGRKS